MHRCRICGEILQPEERFRGTCTECESMITELISVKADKGIYSSKLRWKA